jgi:hypothetical protein
MITPVCDRLQPYLSDDGNDTLLNFLAISDAATSYPKDLLYHITHALFSKTCPSKDLQ